ncbi:MAG: hypothetical protein RRC34_03170 [Lentisphaeria bacterium]|nr:hypothetical protein [Lentisphaeria bacterium]
MTSHTVSPGGTAYHYRVEKKQTVLAAKKKVTFGMRSYNPVLGRSITRDDLGKRRGDWSAWRIKGAAVNQ